MENRIQVEYKMPKYKLLKSLEYSSLIIEGDQTSIGVVTEIICGLDLLNANIDYNDVDAVLGAMLSLESFKIPISATGFMAKNVEDPQWKALEANLKSHWKPGVVAKYAAEGTAMANNLLAKVLKKPDGSTLNIIEILWPARLGAGNPYGNADLVIQTDDVQVVDGEKTYPPVFKYILCSNKAGNSPMGQFNGGFGNLTNGQDLRTAYWAVAKIWIDNWALNPANLARINTEKGITPATKPYSHDTSVRTSDAIGPTLMAEYETWGTEGNRGMAEFYLKQFASQKEEGLKWLGNCVRHQLGKAEIDGVPSRFTNQNSSLVVVNATKVVVGSEQIQATAACVQQGEFSLAGPVGNQFYFFNPLGKHIGTMSCRNGSGTVGNIPQKLKVDFQPRAGVSTKAGGRSKVPKIVPFEGSADNVTLTRRSKYSGDQTSSNLATKFDELFPWLKGSDKRDTVFNSLFASEDTGNTATSLNQTLGYAQQDPWQSIARGVDKFNAWDWEAMTPEERVEFEGQRDQWMTDNIVDNEELQNLASADHDLSLDQVKSSGLNPWKSTAITKISELWKAKKAYGNGLTHGKHGSLSKKAKDVKGTSNRQPLKELISQIKEKWEELYRNKDQSLGDFKAELQPMIDVFEAKFATLKENRKYSITSRLLGE